MKKIYILILILFSSYIQAAEFTGSVKGFYINSSNLALVTLKNGDNTPNCGSTNGWDFQFDSTTEYGKQWVSLLLASRISKTEIIAGYTPNENGICTPIYFYYYDY